MNKCYIVYYKDGTMHLFSGKPKKENHHIDSRFFETNDDFEIIQLCQWVVNGLRHSQVIEITDKIKSA
jgi:hypothetical protein